jgi:hypothetical protein
MNAANVAGSAEHHRPPASRYPSNAALRLPRRFNSKLAEAATTVSIAVPRSKSRGQTQGFNIQ